VSARWSRLLWRAVKFYSVGAGGTLVQLASLVALLEILALPCLAATALAVELSVLHNFLWHERFTWRDRPSLGARQVLVRLIRFNGTTGALSLAGNLLVMRALVGTFHLPYLVANLLAIAACGLLNFLLSDRWVFRAAASPLRPLQP
jgi:putative flippase GtrA